MQTVTEQTTASYREKGSKFIGYLVPSETATGFEEQLNAIVSRHPDATHHCYAYRIGPSDPVEFIQDDGEPRGTAGLPILNQLKSGDLINCASVVVRYYGGTNLGRSGLIQAYGKTAAGCIQKAELRALMPILSIRLTYPYDRQNEIERLKSQFDLIEREAEYREDVTIHMGCPAGRAEDFLERLASMRHLDIEHENLGRDHLVR
ncbi:MAG: YigZ family protein [Balneolaceae bacterium]|nr:YigZ family protein [Balneolaceae bacterium]